MSASADWYNDSEKIFQTFLSAILNAGINLNIVQFVSRFFARFTKTNWSVLVLKNCIQNTAKPYLVHYTTQRYLKLYLDRHVNSQHHWQLAGWSRQVIPPALEWCLANGTHPKTSQYLKAITGEPSCNWPQRNNLTSCSVDVSWHKLLEFNQSILIVFFLAFSRNTN